MDFSEINKLKITDEKVEEVRCKLREDLVKARDHHRSSAFDKNRFLESEILTEEDVKKLCGRIKRLKHANEEDLTKLTTAFYQREENISVFLKTTGAINVIIKEFIGNDHEKRILAGQVLLNLSLADGDCSKIATFAGAYLMIYLRNLTCVVLNKICIWTIQNLISSSGHKSLDILMSQQLLANTLNIVQSSGNDELVHESMVLLDLILERKYSDLSMDEKEEVTDTILSHVQRKSDDYIGLQCLLRIIKMGVWNVEKARTNELVSLLSLNVIKFPSSEDHRLLYFSVKGIIEFSRLDLLYLSVFVQRLFTSSIKISNLINEAVRNVKLFVVVKDMMLLAAMIMNHPDAENYLAYDDIVSNLQVSKFFEF